MSFYDSGYLQDSDAWTLKSRNYGTLTLHGKNFHFDGRKGRTVDFCIDDITKIRQEGAKVVMNMKDGAVWCFAFSPFFRAISISEAREGRRKAEAMIGLIEYVRGINNPLSIRQSMAPHRVREREVQKMKGSNEEELRPIKEKIVELSKKYSRLLIIEIEEELNLGISQIRKAIKDMIEKQEIKAKYFSSSDTVVFQIDPTNNQ